MLRRGLTRVQRLLLEQLLAEQGAVAERLQSNSAAGPSLGTAAGRAFHAGARLPALPGRSGYGPLLQQLGRGGQVGRPERVRRGRHLWGWLCRQLPTASHHDAPLLPPDARRTRAAQPSS